MTPVRTVVWQVLWDLLTIARVHVALLLKLALLTIVGLFLSVVGFALYAQLIGPAVYAQVVDLATSFSTLSLIAVGAAVPVLIVALLACVAWAGAVILGANARLVRGRLSVIRALGGSARRVLPALGALVVWILAVVAAILLAPLITLAGLVLIVVTRFTKRRPSLLRLIVIAIPFGVAATLLVRWSLAMPAVWLDHLAVHAALRASWERVGGQVARVVAVLLVVVLVAVSVALGIQAATALLPTGIWTQLASSVLPLLLTGPLPFIAGVVLFRSNRAAAKDVEPRAGAKRARVAAVVILSLVVPGAIVGGVAPAAEATGSTAVSFHIQPDSAPVLAGVPSLIDFTVSNAVTAEGVQPAGTLDISIDGTPLTGPFGPTSFGSNPYQLSHTFTAGDHLIEAHYSGDSTYAAADQSLNLSVGGPSSTALVTSTGSAVYGNDVTLTATVTSSSGTPTGDVEFSAANESLPAALLGTATLDGSGVATYHATTLLPNSNAITAHYLGAGGIIESTSTAQTVVIASAQTTTSFTVAPASPSDAGAALTATVVVSSTETPATPQGTASVFRVGDSTALATAPLVAGSVDLGFTLAPGLSGVSVVFTPDVGFVGSDDTGNHTVSTYPSSVALSASAATTVSGQSVDFTATITAGGTPGGTVTFSSGATVLGSAPVASGAATLTLSDLAVGGYSVVASYSGDSSTAAGDSSALAHTVTKSDVDVTVSSTSLAPTYGDSITIDVHVAAASPGSGTPGGTVILSRDGAVVASGPVNFSGAASFTVSTGDAGSRSFSAAYQGDTRFASGSGTLPLSVAQIATTTTVFDSSDRDATYGTSQTYAGSVSTSVSGIVPTGTIQLWAGGAHVADGTLTGTGTFSITTDKIPVGTGLEDVWLSYTGDTDFVASDTHSPSGVIHLTMSKYSATPVLDYTGTAALGGTVNLQATFATPGDGPSGLVTFSTLADGVIGTAPVINGVATLPHALSAIRTYVSASFAGDGNFAATATSTPLTINATGASATIVLANPGTLDYGTLLTLTATVTLGDGSTPTGTVNFSTTGNLIIADGVTIGPGGVATVPFCAGDTAGCPGGVAHIGNLDQTIVVSYAASSTHLGGLSNAVAYHVVNATTSTALVVTPTNIAQGSAVFLTATVAGVTSSATPAGSVSFYGVDPLGGEAFIATAPLVAGVASVTTQTGGGLTDLRWPAISVIARYTPAAGFSASAMSVAVTVNRIATSAAVFVPTVTAFAPTYIQVTLSHDPGTIAAFTGSVLLTADTGATCTIHLPATLPLSCPITWSTAGSHSVTAAYSGDVIFEPSGSGTVAAPVAPATPVLNSNVPGIVAQGATVTVSWHVFDATTSGTITVTADGSVWCTVAVSVGSCSGSFASTGTVPVSVVFSGDSNWISIGDALTTTVTGCLTADVYSATPAYGSVTVDTAPNCGSGYTSGTIVTITAHPIAPNLFATWQKLVSGALASDTTDQTTTFAITTDFNTWTHVATFAAPCYTLTTLISGSGGASLSPSPNCASLDGTPGYTSGTTVVAYPDPGTSPDYGDLQEFWYFSGLSAGTVKNDSSGRPYYSVAMTGPQSVILNFGERCRVLKLTGATVTTQPNCRSPFATGYYPYTRVTLAPAPTATQALVGWSVGGKAAPALGSSATPTVQFLLDDLAVQADYVDCYTLTVTIDGIRDLSNEEVGTVTTTPAPNCPDGSRRYVAGTPVTLTPTVTQAATSFRGWDDDLTTGAYGAVAGPITAAAKKVTMIGDITLAASFFQVDACSHLNILGDPSAVQFATTGCGAGFYYDAQKQLAARNKVNVSTLASDKYRSTLTVTTPASTKLDVYAGVKGTTGSCFGSNPPGGSTADASWHYYGPIPRPVTNCNISGDISITLQQCQSIVSVPQFTVVGKPGTYTTGALPAALYMEDPSTGGFGSYDLSGTDWAQAVPVAASLVPNADDPTADPTVALNYDPQQPGPCVEAGNAFPAGQLLALEGLGAGVVFTLDGWAESDGFDAENPLLRYTDTDSRAMIVHPSYSITCHTISFGEGVTPIGDVPRCPGSSEADSSFIAGSTIHVTTPYKIGTQTLVSYAKGVVSGQITEDATTKDQTAFVIVDQDKSVTARYVTPAEAVGVGIVRGLKIGAGIIAVVLPVLLSIAAPPLGAYLTVLAVGGVIANFIPGGDRVAAVYDLLNPTKVTECVTLWGFSNPTVPTSDPSTVHDVKTIAGGLNKARQLKNSLSVPSTAVAGVKPSTGITSALSKALAKVKTGVSNVKGALDAKVGLDNLKTGLKGVGAAASIAWQLYDDGIGNISGAPLSVDQLANTDTMANCLAQDFRTLK